MSFDPVPRAVPSKLDRVFRAALFSLGLVAIVLIGCAYMWLFNRICGLN